MDGLCRCIVDSAWRSLVRCNDGGQVMWIDGGVAALTWPDEEDAECCIRSGPRGMLLQEGIVESI